jgi:hypothetical protein
MTTPPKPTEWGLYAESAADADGRVTLRLQWPSKVPTPPPAPPSPHAAELKAAWPAKWMLVDTGYDAADLTYDANGVTLRVRYFGGWEWELSADEDFYQNSTNGYSRNGDATTAIEAVAALKSALREYANRLLELAQ